MQVGIFRNYPIFISDKPTKKYYALVNGRKVYFGSRGYDQYYDIFHVYSEYDHYDKERRNRYYQRHKKDVGKKGNAGWFAANILWPR